jgi:hypothetical protein
LKPVGQCDQHSLLAIDSHVWFGAECRLSYGVNLCCKNLCHIGLCGLGVSALSNHHITGWSSPW